MSSQEYRNLRRAVLIGMLSVIALPALPFARAQVKSNRSFAPDPKRRYWDEALSPEKYMRAYHASGQAEAAKRDTAPAVAPTGWTRSGPLGNFPERRYNGRMGAIFVDEHATGYDVYVGGSAGGLWWARGTDGEPAWTSIGETLPNPAVHAIAVDPADFDKIIVGTGDFNRYGGAGMFSTANGGATWTAVSLPVDPAAFFEIFHFPGDPNEMSACSSSGILRSVDRGLNWDLMEDGLCTDLAIDESNPAIQYATFMGKGTDGVDNGVYKTTDGWLHSTRITDADLPSGEFFARASIAVCRGEEANLALLVETDGDLGGIFRSSDAGENWNRISPIGGLNGFGQIWHAQALTIRPGNPDDIFAGSVKLWRTVDGGSTWSLVADYGHADITQLHFDDASGDDKLWILNDGGIYKRTIPASGIGFTQSWNGAGATGLNCSQVHNLDAERDMQVIGLQDNGVLQSFDSGSSWNFYTGGDGFGVEIVDSLAERYWYVDGFWSDPHPTLRIWRKPFGSGKQEASIGDHWHERLFYDRYADRVYSAGGDGVRSSPESGSLGFTLNINLPAPPDDEANDKFVYGSRLHGDELYVTYWHAPKLTVCRKSGGVWFTNTTGSITSGYSVDQVYVSTEQPGESWAGIRTEPGYPKILHTTDYWNTWTDITGSLGPVHRVKTIAVTPMKSKQIFVGTDIGVFWTRDGGATWSPFQDGLPVVLCTDIHYVPDPNRSGTDKLVVATFGRGVYSRSIAGPPLTYVDQDFDGDEDGMFANPYNTVVEGVADTPPGGTMVLRGDDYPVTSPLLINTEMLIRPYDGSALLGG